MLKENLGFSCRWSTVLHVGGSLCFCTNQLSLEKKNNISCAHKQNSDFLSFITQLHHDTIWVFREFLKNVLLPGCFKATLRMFFYHLVSRKIFKRNLFILLLLFYVLSVRIAADACKKYLQRNATNVKYRFLDV